MQLKIQEYITGRMKHIKNTLKQINTEMYWVLFWQDVNGTTKAVVEKITFCPPRKKKSALNGKNGKFMEFSIFLQYEALVK